MKKRMFKIESISSDRRMDGDTLIKASTMNGDEKIFLRISVKNTEIEDKEKIRASLMESYSRYERNVNTDKIIKVGDYI